MATRSKAKRIQLNLLITREMKARIEALARKSRESQGRVAELLMLKQFAYEDLVAAMRKGIEEIHDGNVKAELTRLGYTRMRDASGVFSAWFEPGFPNAPERSGFIPWNEGEQLAGEVVIAGDEDGEPEPGQ